MATQRLALPLFTSIFIFFASVASITTTNYTHTGRETGDWSTCLALYQKGGAPAVFQSRDCPNWKLHGYSSHPQTKGAGAAGGMECQVATLRGHRKYQEDRTFCDLDVRIPFPDDSGGIKEVTVGMIAVFDGHNGAEASDMASNYLFDYFKLHAHFLQDSTFSVAQEVRHAVNLWFEYSTWKALDRERNMSLRTSEFDNSYHFEILKEALLRAIRDLDTKFSEEASRRNLNSGSTATVILMAVGKILVANVGDSKALLCSEKFQSPSDARAKLLRLHRERRRNGAVISLKDREHLKSASSNGIMHFSVEELTTDHSPDRYDEKSRIEAEGGYVANFGGVARVNGQLAVSRAIGDLKFKRYGVIAEPEIMDWQSLSANDSYLVAASDGVFEEFNPQDVCDLLWEAQSPGELGVDISSSCSYSEANCIVESAFKRGSTDNLSAVVVRLRSTLVSRNRSHTAADDVHTTAVLDSYNSN